MEGQCELCGATEVCTRCGGIPSTNGKHVKPETLKLLESAQANNSPVILAADAVTEVLEIVKLCKQQGWVLERTAKQLEIALAQRSRLDEII
jgi:hypothetical protein